MPAHGGERTDTGLLLLKKTRTFHMLFDWFWCPSGVPGSFCSFMVCVPQHPCICFFVPPGPLKSLHLLFSALNPSVSPLVPSASWFSSAVPKLAGEVRGKPVLLCLSFCTNSASRGGFGYPWSPSVSFSSALEGLGVPFGVPQSFQSAFCCPPPLELCVLWCPQEPSMGSVGPITQQRSKSKTHGLTAICMGTGCRDTSF